MSSSWDEKTKNQSPWKVNIWQSPRGGELSKTEGAARHVGVKKEG